MKKINIQSLFFEYIYYILLFLACMNFFTKGTVLFFALIVFFILFKTCFFRFDFNLLVYLVLSCSVVLSSIIYYKNEDILKGLNFILPYYIGYSGYIQSTQKKLFVKKNIFFIAFGFGFFVFYTYIFNYNIPLLSARYLYSPWTNDLISVTLVGLASSVFVGYSFFGLLVQKKYAIKIITLFFTIIVISLNLKTATRSPIVIFFIVYILSFPILIMKEKKKGLVKCVLFLLFFSFIYLFLLAEGIGNSPLVERLNESGLESSRYDITIEYFTYMTNYLWGGGYIRSIVGELPHNLWLEAYDVYGLFAFLSLLIICIKSVCKCIYVFFQKEIKSVDVLFCCFFLAVLIQLCLEPILDGYPSLFYAYILVDGISDAYIKSYSIQPYQAQE